MKKDMKSPEGPKMDIKEIQQQMKTFKNIVKLAEKEVMRKCDILLCTSTAANPHRLHFLAFESRDKQSSNSKPRERFQIKQVGDHQQLSPVVLCNEAREFGMDSTLFSKYYDKAVMLQRQYRMHEAIADFPSRQFYDGKLKLGQEERQKSKESVWPGWKKRIVFCHCEGVEEKRVVATDEACEKSAMNKIEAEHVIRIAKRLVYQMLVDPSEIAILSQYRAQTSLIEQELSSSENPLIKKVNVQTVIKSQGNEWDYIIFTTVRSMQTPEIDPNPSIAWILRNLGSIADQHQICVALTRARKGLAIIGNKNLLRVDETWKELISDYQSKNCIVDAKDFMNN